MNKKEAMELEQLRRENATLKRQLEGREKSPVYFRAGDRVNGPQFFLPERESVYFGGMNVRLDEDGWVIIIADDVLNVVPQASNALKLFSETRFRK